MSAAAGGFLGLLFMAVIDPRGQIDDIDSLSIVVGALIGVGIDRALRH